MDSSVVSVVSVIQHHKHVQLVPVVGVENAWLLGHRDERG